MRSANTLRVLPALISNGYKHFDVCHIDRMRNS
jgi:hypothetical protein